MKVHALIINDILLMYTLLALPSIHSALYAGSTDVCSPSNHMPVPNLRSRSLNYTMGDTLLCDWNLTAGWYSTTNYAISREPPPFGICGTVFPVWMTGSIPGIGEEVDTLMCQMGIFDDCSKSFSVRIKNCGTHVVYFLKPLDSCYSAYCFELQNYKCDTVTGVEISFSDIRWIQKDISKETRSGQQFIPSIELRCDFIDRDTNNTNILYLIQWLVNSNLIVKETYITANETHTAYLNETDILDSTITSISSISCEVSKIDPSIGQQCLPVRSIELDNSINVQNKTIFAHRKETLVLKFALPFPYVTPTYTVNGSEVNPDSLLVSVTIPNANFSNFALCTDDVSEHRIPSYKYSEKHLINWNPSNLDQEITLFVSDKLLYNVSGHMTVRLEVVLPTNSDDRIYNRMPATDVQVFVEDKTDLWINKYCGAYTDPHIKTFNGHRYECQQRDCQEEYTYILYKNEAFNQEIQVRHFYCWDHASCICAASARSGRDIFIIDLCDGAGVIDFALCEDESLTVVKISDKEYKIIFPTGTQVFIYFMEWPQEDNWIINIEIYASTYDEHKLTGLCGNLDNATTDSADPNDSRLKTLGEDDFSGNYYDIKSLTNTQALQKRCKCTQLDTSCSYKTYIDHHDAGQRLNCTMSTYQIRKKRYVPRMYGRIRYQRNRWFNSMIKKRSLSASPVALSDKDDNPCWIKLFHSEFYEVCSTKVDFSTSVLNCLSDLEITGDENMTQFHVDSTLSTCKRLIEQNKSTTANGSDSTIIAALYNICESNCSQHGKCSKGICFCDNGFGGKDCSFDLSRSRLNPPASICDLTVSEDKCRKIIFKGKGIVDSLKGTCLITRECLSTDMQPSSTYVVSSRFEKISMTKGWCEIQSVCKTHWITKLNIEMEISGVQSMDKRRHHIYIYQSLCQKHENTSGDSYFTLKPDYCFINGVCVAFGKINQENECLACRPSKSKFQWTIVCINNQEMNTQRLQIPESSEDLTVYVILAVLIVFLISIMVVYLGFTIKKKRSSIAHTDEKENIIEQTVIQMDRFPEFTENMEPRILKTFKEACEREQWDEFNSLYLDLLNAQEIPDSISPVIGELPKDLYDFVETTIADNVKKVYCGFCLERKQTVLVIIIHNVFFDYEKAKNFKGLPIVYKQWTAITRESINIRGKKMYEFDDNVHREISNCLSKHSRRLMKTHSNVEIISVSSYRSRNNGSDMSQENCIVIYCSIKKIIPLGERFFEKSCDGFKTDIREGFFYLYPSSNTYTSPTSHHPQLKVGGEISKRDGRVKGTLGGFVEIDEHNIGFITCAHVVHDDIDPMVDHDVEIVQPSFGQSGSNCCCGRLKYSAHTTIEGTTIEASLIKIVESRKPNEISFAGVTKQQTDDLGFSPNAIYSGELLNHSEVLFKKPCYKSGARTEFTTGKLEIRAGNVRYLRDFRDPKRDYMFFNQYTVSSVEPGDFANPGDSGAFVFQCVDRSDGKKSFACIGMLVGGTSECEVIVTPIRDVLDALCLKSVNKLCTFEK